jgi:hypothetical protein
MGLLAIAVLAQNASAVLTEYLPESSYATTEGNWQGFKYYDELFSGERAIHARVDFAVYDQTNLKAGSKEETLVNSLNLDGQFIYAYQVLNTRSNSDAEITYFALTTLGGASLSGIDDTTSYDDGIGGKGPTDIPLQCTWEFNGNSGMILKDEYSWFLVFSSDYSPVAGDFQVRTIDDSGPTPIPPEVPEPGILTLLGIGGAMVLSRRKKNIKQ